MFARKVAGWRARDGRGCRRLRERGLELHGATRLHVLAAAAPIAASHTIDAAGTAVYKMLLCLKKFEMTGTKKTGS